MAATRQIAIRGGMVISMAPDRPQWERADVLVEGERIAAVGALPLAPADAEGRLEINAAGMVVLPGFVNTHHHLYQTLLRGLGADLELVEWLKVSSGKYGQLMGPDDVRAAVALGLAESLDSGVTTTNDFIGNLSGFPWAEVVLDCFRAAGARGRLGMGSNRDGFDMACVRRVRDNCFPGGRSADGLVSLGVAPRGPDQGVPETEFRGYVDFARAEGLPMHLHMMESKRRRDARNVPPQDQPVAVLERTGALGPDLLLAHCVHLTPDEIHVVAGRGVHVSHNPLANMRLASGIMPLPDMLAAGLNVGLGLDGSGSSDNNDFFACLRAAIGLHRALRLNPQPPPYEFLKMATVNGARAMGLAAEIGSLEAGKQADIILVDTRQLHFAPVNDPVAQLFFCGQPRHVDTVLVAGQIRKRGKQLVGVDVEQLVADAEQAARRVIGDLATSYR